MPAPRITFLPIKTTILNLVILNNSLKKQRISKDSKLGKKFDKIFDRILDATVWVAGSLIIAIMLMVSSSILLRMFGNPQG